MADHLADDAAQDSIPATLRRVVYSLAVLINAAAVTAYGLGYISADNLVAILAGLGILSSGLALGYVPKRV